MGKLPSASYNSVSCSQQSQITPLTPAAESEMIEGFKLFLGIPLILMSVGCHVHQSVVVPENPWSDTNIKSHISPCEYWRKLFKFWLKDLYLLHIGDRVSFHTSLINHYGGVIITGKRSPSLSFADFQTGSEILRIALDVIQSAETKGRLPKIFDTIGFNLYQAWVNLMMSWINIMSLGYEDMCDVEALIVDPEQTLTPLLSALIMIVQVFGDYYILPEKTITIYKEENFENDENDEDDCDCGSKDTSSLRVVFSSLFQLPVLRMSSMPTSSTYIAASTIAAMRSFSSSYVITILQALIKLEEKLSANSQSKLRDILGQDLIKEVFTLIESQKSNINENEIILMNECKLKLHDIIEVNDIGIVINNYDDDKILGKRKSIEENEDSKSIKRNKVVAILDELMSSVYDFYECNNNDDVIKLQIHRQEIEKIINLSV
jgi:hypothetical protein